MVQAPADSSETLDAHGALALPAPPASGTRIVVDAGAAARAAWAAFLAQRADATLFHDPLWSEIVHDVFGHRPCPLLAWRGPRLVGVLPLMEVRSLLAGRMLVSMPYATYGGALADDDETRALLIHGAEALARARRARVVELRSAHAQTLSAGWRRDERYACFTRALPESLAALETFLPRKARAAARQAQRRDQFHVRHDPELLPYVWRLYARSMRRLGSINYPYRLFAALRARLGPCAWVSTVWDRRRPVAGVLSLVYGDTVMPYFAGADERVRGGGAMNLLYFAVMRRAVQAGARRFDFGRSRLGAAGACAFKRHQGFEPRKLEYQRYSTGGGRAPDLSPDNARFGPARAVWRRLPLGLTRPLGAWLSTSIPG